MRSSIFIACIAMAVSFAAAAPVSHTGSQDLARRQVFLKFTLALTQPYLALIGDVNGRHRFRQLVGYRKREMLCLVH